MKEESEAPAAGSTLPKIEPLTEWEIAKGRRIWGEIEKRLEANADERPTDPCHCGRVMLKPSWGAITAGPTWSSHRREECHDRPRPRGINDADWQNVLDARAQEASNASAPSGAPEAVSESKIRGGGAPLKGK